MSNFYILHELGFLLSYDLGALGLTNENSNVVTARGTIKNNPVTKRLPEPITPIDTPKVPMLIINDTAISLLVNTLDLKVLFGINHFFILRSNNDTLISEIYWLMKLTYYA